MIYIKDVNMKPKTWIALSIFVLIAIIIISGYFILKVYNEVILANKDLKANISTGELYNLYNVEITSSGFVPATIEIGKGDAVMWKNQDYALHRVVSTSGDGFDSGKLYRGQNYTKIFDNETIIEYSCPYHPYTKGKIIVGNGNLFSNKGIFR